MQSVAVSRTVQLLFIVLGFVKVRLIFILWLLIGKAGANFSEELSFCRRELYSLSDVRVEAPAI